MSDAPKTIGQYEVLELIAKGSTGQVYKAFDASSKQSVAIKVLPRELAGDDESLERFHREAESVSMIQHPNVVRVLDRGQDGDLVYFVMEYVPGTSLDKILKRRRLSLPEVFQIFKGVAEGLQAAHAKDIVHRDLNPGNILVSEDLSVVKLADFGISRSASLSRQRGTITSTSMSMGTLHYIAPEQAADMASADARADIYSIGVLLYEMLTGNVPIGRFSLPSRDNSEVPAEVDSLVLKCLEGDPTDRYTSVRALLGEIEHLEDRLRLSLVSELRGIGRTFRHPTTQILKHGRKLLAGIVGVLVVGLIGYAAWSRMSPDPVEPIVVAATERPARTPEPPLETALDQIVPPPQDGAAAAEDARETGENTTANAADDPPGEETQGDPEPPPAESATNAGGTGATRPTGNEARRLLGLAQAKARDGLLDQSLGDIDSLIATYPNSPQAPEALFLRARIEEAEKRYEDALGTYTKIGALSSEAEARAKARYRFGRVALASDLPNGKQLAMGVFDEVARAYPRTEYAPLALASKAALEDAANVRVTSEEFGRRVPAAFLTSIQIIEGYPDSPAAERAFWIAATEYEDRKLWDRAVDAFWQLGTRFSDTELDAWWKAGQILDRRVDDAERAVLAYQRVPETSSHAEDARKRISKLTR